MQCRDFPGPGDQTQHQILMNPMREYIHSEDSHHHHRFNMFKNHHNKDYDTELEHHSRMHIFRQNSRYIDSINRKGLSYTLAINHLADKTDEELRVIRGKAKRVTNKPNQGQAFDINQFKRKDLPDRLFDNNSWQLRKEKP